MYKNKRFLFLNNIKNEINKNNNIRNTIIGAVLLIIYSILTKDYTIYLLLNSIITVAMIVVFIYVSIIRTKFVDRTFIKDFEFTYLVLILIIILNVIGFIYLFEYTPSVYFIFLFSVQATLECCEIKKFFLFKNSCLKSIVICIMCVMLFYLFKINYIMSSDYRASFFIGIVVVSIGLCVSTLENVVKNRKKFTSDEFIQVIFYMFSISIYYIGLLFLLTEHKEISGIIIFIKCITFYRFYNFRISKVLDNSLEKINENIEIATKTKKELNSILKKRNIILNEANVMLQKSQDKNNKLIDSYD